MSSIKYERLRELELALALKNREINVLQSQIDDCREAQDGAFGGLVEKCLKEGATAVEAVNDIPYEQLNNAKMQLEAAAETNRRSAKVFLRSAKEADLAVFEHEKEHQILQGKLEEIRATTGLSAETAQQRVEEHAKENAKKAEEHRKSEFAVETDEEGNPNALVISAESRSLATALMPVEIRVQKRHLEEELHALELIKKQQARAILKQEEELEKRRAVRNKKCDVLAQVQVANREMNEHKATLKKLVAEHEKLDKYTQKFKDSQDHTCRAIMDKNAGTLRNKLEEGVERRRLQDRVVKAQEYRLKQLQDRVKTVQDALARHGLAQEVEMRIAEAEREAARAAGDNQSSSIVRLNDNEEDYYNVDAIVPVEETVHPAIYSLFVQDRERLQKRVNTQALMIQDKDNGLEALEAKIADLTSSCDESADTLHEMTIANEKELNQMRDEVSEELQKYRDEYAGLVEANRKNQSTLIKSRSKIHNSRSSSAAPASSNNGGSRSSSQRQTASRPASRTASRQASQQASRRSSVVSRSSKQ